MTCCPSRPNRQPAEQNSPKEAHVSEKRCNASGIVDIPGGTALIGTNSPVFRVDGEGPLKKKKLRPFRMDAAVVTNARFTEFVEATGYETEAERIGDSLVFFALLPDNQPPSPAVADVPWWREIEGASWRLPRGRVDGRAPGPEDPVVHVTWNDARAFAAWAGGELPTEAQWEHAARGGLGDVRYPWGNENPNDENFFPCNIWQGRFPDSNLQLDGYFGIAPARTFEPNHYGLYNMVGNVWEWTIDPFRVRSVSKRVSAIHAGKERFKLSKGGSFLCHNSYCFRYRIAARGGTSPDTSTSHQGFRLIYRV